MNKKFFEWHIGAPRPDGQVGHGYGTVTGGMAQDSVASKRPGTYPYDEPDDDDPSEEEDDLDLTLRVMTRLVKKTNRQGRGHHRHDPSPGHDRRSFGSSDNVAIEGLGRSQPISRKTKRDDPQTKVGPYGPPRKRDTAVGGMKPTIYTMAPFRGTGTLKGWAGAPHPFIDDLDEPAFFLDDIFDNEELPIQRSNRSIKNALNLDNDEDLFDEDAYLEFEEYNIYEDL